MIARRDADSRGRPCVEVNHFSLKRKPRSVRHYHCHYHNRLIPQTDETSLGIVYRLLVNICFRLHNAEKQNIPPDCPKNLNGVIQVYC